MTLTLILLAAIGVILLAERSAEHLPFAISTLSLSATAISFIVGDFDRAILLAGVLAAAITAASGLWVAFDLPGNLRAPQPVSDRRQEVVPTP